MTILQQIWSTEEERARLERENQKLRRLVEAQVEEGKPADCSMCRHFIQHYIHDAPGRAFVRTNAGHCAHKDVRRRKITPDLSVCGYFEPGQHKQYT